MTAPMVLLPGLMCDARVFAAQRAHYPDAFVVNGFGERDDIAAMAQHVLATAPARMSLLGHSMGARVALEVYRAAPERVERLALVSTGVHPRREAEAGNRYALRDLGCTQGAASLVDRWLPPMVAPARAADRALLEPLRRMAIEQGVAVFAAQTEALLNRPEVESLLPEIRCPVLVAVGACDQWSPPAQHRDIAARIPGASLRIVDAAGHMLPAEAPDAMNRLLDEWLALPAQTGA